MKKPNYGFEKRKKEMKRQKKNEAKRLAKLNKANPPAEGTLNCRRQCDAWARSLFL